jgi:hypothetical protein
MGGQQVDRELVSLRHLDLREHGIGLQVYAHRDLYVLVAQHGHPAHVHEHVGRAERPLKLLFRHPVGPSVFNRVPICPRGSEADALQQPSHVGDRRSRVVGDSVPLGVVGPAPRVLEVEDFVAEPLEPPEVLQHLPGHAGERHRAEAADDHEPQSLTHWPPRSRR